MPPLRTYRMASIPDPHSKERVAWSHAGRHCSVAVLKRTAVFSIDQFMAGWKELGFRPVSHLAWIKSHCSRDGYTRSHHEVGFLLAEGKPLRPAKPLSDVLPRQYTHNELHSNQKPVAGIAPLIKAFSCTGDIVLDPFAGSGAT